MARCKNSPETVRVKSQLAERLREVRAELFGERGGPELSRKLGLPVRTWYNYELGVTVPAEILLRFVELTEIEPNWLLHGKGPKFRQQVTTPRFDFHDSSGSVTSLLRRALYRLEQEGASGRNGRWPYEDVDFQIPPADAQDTIWIRVEDSLGNWVDDGPGPSSIAAQRDWLPEPRDCHCLLIDDEAMTPVLMPGAYVIFSEAEPDIEELDGKLVVVQSQGRRLVRWLQLAGSIALLRAENAGVRSPLLTVNLENQHDDQQIFKVLWTCSPHAV